MKKVAQPEHAYTGYVLRWTEDAPPEPEKRRNAPILGYKGHLRHAEDCIGTTFTRGVEIAARPGVLTASDIARRGSHLALTSAKDPRVKMQQGRPGSGYGEFAGASGYGEFASPGSGYGAFDNASGYGAFQAPPVRPTGADATSSYGAFDGASGYGAFQVPPNGTSGSGYGAFDGASGYGAFQSAPESPKDMATPRYGMFDGASAYGDFAVPPKSARGGSGYGEFDGASGYGQFLDAPSNQDHATEPPRDRRHQIHSPRRGFPDGSMTGMRYTQAIRACGGEHAVKRLWQVAAHTISQRYMKRTELLQAVKRSFEKHEQESTLVVGGLQGVRGSPRCALFYLSCAWHALVLL